MRLRPNKKFPTRFWSNLDRFLVSDQPCSSPDFRYLCKEAETASGFRPTNPRIDQILVLTSLIWLYFGKEWTSSWQNWKIPSKNALPVLNCQFRHNRSSKSRSVLISYPLRPTYSIWSLMVFCPQIFDVLSFRLIKMITNAFLFRSGLLPE